MQKLRIIKCHKKSVIKVIYKFLIFSISFIIIFWLILRLLFTIVVFLITFHICSVFSFFRIASTLGTCLRSIHTIFNLPSLSYQPCVIGECCLRLVFKACFQRIDLLLACFTCCSNSSFVGGSCCGSGVLALQNFLCLVLFISDSSGIP